MISCCLVFFVPGGFGRRSSWTLFRCLGRNGYLWTLHFDGGASLSRIVGGDTSGWIDNFLLVGMGLGVWCMNVCGLLACKKMWLFSMVLDSGFADWSDSYWAQIEWWLSLCQTSRGNCASKFSLVLHRKMAETYDHQEFQVPKMEVVNLIRLVLWWVFPCKSLTYSLYRWVPPYYMTIFLGLEWLECDFQPSYWCLGCPGCL